MKITFSPLCDLSGAWLVRVMRCVFTYLIVFPIKKEINTNKKFDCSLIYLGLSDKIQKKIEEY